MKLVSTDINHFVQSITPHASEGHGNAGYIVDEDGHETPMFFLNEKNPASKYHINVIDGLVSDWTEFKDGTTTDVKSRDLDDGTKLYLMDALLNGMLEISK